MIRLIKIALLFATLERLNVEDLMKNTKLPEFDVREALTKLEEEGVIKKNSFYVDTWDYKYNFCYTWA